MMADDLSEYLRAKEPESLVPRAKEQAGEQVADTLPKGIAAKKVAR